MEPLGRVQGLVLGSHWLHVAQTPGRIYQVPVDPLIWDPMTPYS